MNDEDGDGVMKYSGLWGDLWNGESSELGFSYLTILSISHRHVYLNKLWTVRILLSLNNGFVYSFS